MSLPFFDILPQYFPHSTIDLVAKESVQELFAHHPAIRAIHPFAKSSLKGVWGLVRYGKMLQQTHGPYDLFITLPHSFSAALLGYGVGSPIRLGYRAEGRSLLLTHHFRQPHGMLRAYSYCHLLEAYFRKIDQPQPVNAQAVSRIALPFSASEHAARYLPASAGVKYVVLNVNAEAQSRRLELAKWVELGQRLLRNAEYHFTLVFIGTAKERARVEQTMRGIAGEERLLNFAGKTSVRDLAMLLRDADVVVSNDSGPMHLTNAVGTPLVTFIGAADPVETAPFNQANTVVINKHLPCSPCVKNICRFPTVRCLAQISVDEIERHVLTLLQQGRTTA